MVGAPVNFDLYMRHGDGPLIRVQPMVNTPQPPPPIVLPPPPPPQADLWEQPNGQIKCVFDAIKAHLRWGDNPGETDANMGGSDAFLELMKSLPVQGTCTLGVSPHRTTPIRDKDNRRIAIKWQGDVVKALMYKVQKRMVLSWNGSKKKCTRENCWVNSLDRMIGYCRKDSSKLREFLLLRDATNIQPNIFIHHPDLRMNAFDEENINVYLRSEHIDGKHFPTIVKYIASHPNCRFVIDMSWRFDTTLSPKKFNTFCIAICIMTFLHNNAFSNSTHPKIQLRRGLTIFKNAHWKEVRKILDRNKFKFIVTPATNQLTPNKMFSIRVIKKQDHTYQGDNGNGAVKDGLMTSKTTVHTSGASVGNALPHKPLAQHLETIVMLYQHILDDPVETEIRTRHAEFMGILATLMGTILQQDFKGHPMRPMTEQLTNYNIVFDYNVFTRLFQFKTGCTIVVQREGDGIPIINGKPQFLW
ncbi:hypothetical protein Fcan01_01758 [Folsomia candida]|uniref:Uncharacterized protein n=2 Tax=Folsomia candida TaxID=158441 RepID=A0A226F086_FOLCA|nr:hypothetical protein Fcan01_01758 [Folsomia candida]